MTDVWIIVLVAGLCALGIFVFFMFRHVKKVKNIPRLETEGVVEKVTMNKYRGEEAQFYIVFYVDGKKYLAVLGEAFGAEGLSRNVPVGTKVTVLYNPDNPWDCYCKAKTSR